MARLTQAQWRILVDEQTTSGQTAMAFCAKRGIDNKYLSIHFGRGSRLHVTAVEKTHHLHTTRATLHRQ